VKEEPKVETKPEVKEEPKVETKPEPEVKEEVPPKADQPQPKADAYVPIR